MYKEGDTIKCIKPGLLLFKVGAEVEVVNSDDIYFFVASPRYPGQELRYRQGSVFWERIKKAKAEKKQKVDKCLYRFRTSSPDAIDYEEIHKETVSRDKPLAVVKVKGMDRCVVLVHDSIFNKAYHMKGRVMIDVHGEKLPESIWELESLGAYFGGPWHDSHLIQLTDVSSIKRVVSEIKHAAWDKDPASVSVQVIEV